MCAMQRYFTSLHSRQKQTGSKTCMIVNPTTAHHAVDVVVHHSMSVRTTDYAAMSHSLAIQLRLPD